MIAELYSRSEITQRIREPASSESAPSTLDHRSALSAKSLTEMSPPIRSVTESSSGTPADYIEAGTGSLLSSTDLADHPSSANDRACSISSFQAASISMSICGRFQLLSSTSPRALLT